MIAADTIAAFKASFNAQNIKLCDDFLQQCLMWIEATFPNSSDREKTNIIYEEWLNLDLRDVQLPLLPPKINEAIEAKLQQQMALQLLYVVDISKPKYLQLKSIRSRFDDHTEDVESCGMLKLQLTDGVQEISAIEYKKVPCLNLNLAPGMKICLKPPINIRCGQILLEPCMITLYGGCIPEIAVTHSMENILAAALKQPMNNNPRNGQTDATPTPIVTPQNMLENTAPRPSVSNEWQANDKIESQPQSYDFPSKFAETKSNGMSSDDFQTLDTNNINRVSAIPQMEETTTREVRELGEQLIPTHSLAPIPITTPVAVSAAVTPVQRPIIPISKLNQIKHNVTKGMFKIKMEILVVRERLKVENNTYYMKVVAADESGEIEVVLSNEVLRDLTEIEAKAYLDLCSSGDAFQHTQVILNIAKKINNFYAYVVVKVESGQDPLVTEILEHLQLL